MSDPSHDIHPPRLTSEARNADQARLFLLIVGLCIAAGIAVFLIVIPSWRPTHDMMAQPHYTPYEPSPLFLDGMSERPLVSGVVPRPADASPGIPYVAVRTLGPAAYPVIAKTDRIPVPITRELLRRGRERFEIYCSVCHGMTGGGDGMIVQRGFYPPPSYHIPRLVQAPDSHFFNVITNGYGTMFSYSDRVAPADRWAIVAYIRALQIGVAKNAVLSRELQKPRGVEP